MLLVMVVQEPAQPLQAQEFFMLAAAVGVL